MTLSSFRHVQIILEEIIEDISDGKASKAKLSQAAAQRWISMCKMLLRVLERWDALKRFYVEKEELFPLNGKKDEVRWRLIIFFYLLEGYHCV